jgi:hypothetical protein
MWLWDEHLKLGKTSVFVKRDLRALPLTDAEFEADFFLDRRLSTKRHEAWRGIVVERESGDLLALEDVRWPPPTVNDLATLLARAMTWPPLIAEMLNGLAGDIRGISFGIGGELPANRTGATEGRPW